MVRGFVDHVRGDEGVVERAGREVWKSCEAKLCASGFQTKMRSTQKYCAPGLLVEVRPVGFSGPPAGSRGSAPRGRSRTTCRPGTGFNQVLVVVISGIAVVPLRVPCFLRGLVEVGIGEEA